MQAVLLEGLTFGPACVFAKELEPRGSKLDARANVRWEGRGEERFGVEMKSTSVLGTVEGAAAQILRNARDAGLRPMVFVPYLGEEALLRLSAQGVSGIDLCGNAVILAGSFSLWRSGAPNRYVDSRPVRNPYRGDNSVFARSFLLNPEFTTLSALRDFAQARVQPARETGGSVLLLGTASKTVQALEADMIVVRDADGIRLADRPRLLANLRTLYRRKPGPTLLGKCPLSRNEVWQRLEQARRSNGLRSTATGAASAAHYGVLSGVERLSVYVDNLPRAAELLQVREGRAFADIELIEERKTLLFFDNRRGGDGQVWSSPVQTWVELAQAGPREQEAARSLEERLTAFAAEKPVQWNP